jgi:hypothetical protein
LFENKDHFGYYKVGEYKTFSKMDAILLHDKTGMMPHWNFNDEIFALYDWTIEPKQSLKEFYRQRAQQIRDKYDYLVLFYSGGADSTNILQTFINNNIKLDEVAQFYSYEGDKDYDSNFNAEVVRVAIPWTRKIISANRNTYINHRIIDQSNLIEEIYTLPEIKFDFLYQQNTCLSPNNFSRAYLRKLIKDYKDIIAKGKKLCFIWGSEKPRLYQIGNRYCTKFLDMIDNCVSPLIQQQNFPGYYDELFYWSPDFAMGIIKQAHALLSGLKNLPLNDTFFSSEKTPFGSIMREGKTWHLRDHGVHTLLYEGWDVNTFSVGKKRSPILSSRDDWYLKKNSGSNLRYLSAIEKLDKILSTKANSFWKNGADISEGIKCCQTRPYFLT